jgi:outer membrane autotransporter protein
MDWGAWGQAFGGRADQGTIDQVSGYRAYYGGFVTGIDRAVTDAWRLGGALSYTRTNVDGAGNVDGSHTGVDSYGLTAYASYTGNPWYANLFVSGAQQSYHTKRVVDFTGYSALANGDFDGQQFTAKAEIGYPIALSERLTLTPLGELSYSYSRLDGYTETGGNGAALTVDSSDSYAVRSGIGGKLATTVATPFGEVVPFIQAMWLHQYNDGRTGVTAQYAGDPLGETAFTSFGAKPIADMADLTVGATLMSADDLSVTARYGVQMAPEYTNQTLSLRLRQLF